MRATKAAVPASKVNPGEVYAIRRDDDRLVRFRVTAVVQRREGASGSPHDYRSLIEGYVIEGPPNGERETLTLAPNALLGFYDQHVELVEREKREQEATKAKNEAHRANVTRLLSALYEATGISPPESTRDYNVPFRTSYSDNNIEIATAGIEPLLAFFERVNQPA